MNKIQICGILIFIISLILLCVFLCEQYSRQWVSTDGFTHQKYGQQQTLSQQQILIPRLSSKINFISNDTECITDSDGNMYLADVVVDADHPALVRLKDQILHQRTRRQAREDFIRHGEEESIDRLKERLRQGLRPIEGTDLMPTRKALTLHENQENQENSEKDEEDEHHNHHHSHKQEHKHHHKNQREESSNEDQTETPHSAPLNPSPMPTDHSKSRLNKSVNGTANAVATSDSGVDLKLVFATIVCGIACFVLTVVLCLFLVQSFTMFLKSFLNKRRELLAVAQQRQTNLSTTSPDDKTGLMNGISKRNNYQSAQ